MVVFEERGNRSTRRKPLGAEKRSNKPASEGVERAKVLWQCLCMHFWCFSHIVCWKQHIFRCTDLLSTLYGRNTSVVVSFIMLKSKAKRKQTGRKYSTPPCNSVAAPGPPRDVKVGTPSKRTVTLSWKKPLLYGDDVQLYTVIHLLSLFVANNRHGRTDLDFLKPGAQAVIGIVAKLLALGLPRFVV